MDASGLDETKCIDKSRRRQSANRVTHDSDHVNRSQFPQDNVKVEVASQQFDAPNDRSGYWGLIPDFGNPRAGNLDSFNHGSQMDGLSSSLVSHSMQPTCSESPLVEPIGADCSVSSSSTFGSSKAEDSKRGFVASGSETGPNPGTPEIERIDPKFSSMEIYNGSSRECPLDSGLYGQHGYADALSLNSMAQLNAPFLPIAPIAYPSE